MWCSSCQQDVPGVSSAHDGAICCPRCQDELIPGYGPPVPDANTGSMPIPTAAVEPVADHAPAEADSKPTKSVAKGPEPFTWTDWNFEQDLQATDRIAQEFGLAPKNTTHRIDAVGPSIQVRSGRGRSRRKSSSTGRMLAGSTLVSGMLVFGAGAALLSWSYFVQDSGLWQVGLPVSLAGQGILILGLVLQLYLMRRDGHQTSDSLEQLDEQLAEVREVASQLSSTNSSQAQSFYLHMAEGASPSLLLADLKGQLDLLATRLSDHHR